MCDEHGISEELKELKLKGLKELKHGIMKF